MTFSSNNAALMVAIRKAAVQRQQRMQQAQWSNNNKSKTTTTSIPRPRAFQLKPKKPSIKLTRKSLVSVSVSDVTNEVTCRFGQPVLVKNCTNVTLKIHGKPAKVMVENCTNCEIEVSSRIKSGQLHLSQCQRVTVSLARSAATGVSIEQSQHCNVSLLSGMFHTQVYTSHDTHDVTLTMPMSPDFVFRHRIPSFKSSGAVTFLQPDEADGSYEIVSQESTQFDARTTVVLKKNKKEDMTSTAVVASPPQSMSPQANPSAPVSTRGSASLARGSAQVYTFASGEHSIQCAPTETVILSDCHNAVIRLPPSVLKVIVCNSDHCTVHIQRVRVGTVDVVRSNFCQIQFSAKVPTIAFDLCHNTSLGFASVAMIGSIVTANCQHCSVMVNRTQSFIPESDEQKVVTHSGTQLVVENTVRERGYLMTQEVYARSLQYQAKAEKLMEAHARKLVRFGGNKKN